MKWIADAMSFFGGKVLNKMAGDEWAVCDGNKNVHHFPDVKKSLTKLKSSDIEFEDLRSLTLLVI